MKILVTGGAGFIGRYLVESLSKEHQITIYDNLSNSSESNIANLKADFVKGDILDYQTLLESSRNFDVVIHLAAKTNVTDSVINPKDTMNVNVNGTENILRCCVQNKIKKIIFASSAAVYDKNNNINTEKASINPISPYGKSKKLAEEKIIVYTQKNNLNTVILRMFNIYGKGQTEQYAGVITKFARNISKNIPLEIFGDGKQTRDFISIYDAIESYRCVLNSTNEKKLNIYNIGTGVSTSITELAQMMIKISGKKIKINYKHGKKEDIRNSIADITLAKKELMFAAKIKLKEGLEKIRLDLALN